jgi:alpha-1,3-fucosyltransferase
MKLKNGSLIFVGLILIFLLFYQSGLLRLRHFSIEDVITVTSTETLKDKCVILLWTTYFGLNWFDSLISWNGLKCLPSNCIVTTDRSLFTQSRAIVFHLRDINSADLPKQHLDGQFWVLVNHEAPFNNANENDTEQFKAIEREINWTVTYRRDSDIFAPYGKIVDRNAGDIWMQNVSFERKSKMIAWFVSNCNVPSGRLEYVHELQKYIPVDIYGKCGPLDCTDKDWCQNMLQDTYKFYLAFENTVSW